MSRRKVDLEEAKRVLETDKVFLNGANKFNYVDGGKYGSGATIVIPTEWVVAESGRVESPVLFHTCRDITDNMNLDFDGSASVLFGRSHMSRTGNLVFEITSPTEAKEVFVQVGWGGAFSKTRGQDTSYAQEVGAKWFRSRCSNGGGLGRDFWVLPVEYVRDGEPRDVSQILKRVEDAENARMLKMDCAREEAERKHQALRDGKERFLEEIAPLIEAMKEVDHDFEYQEDEEELRYRVEKLYGWHSLPYENESIDKFQKELDEQRDYARRREEYTPLYRDLEDVYRTAGYCVEYGKYRVMTSKKCKTQFYPFEETVRKEYEYSETSYERFVEDMDKAVEEKKAARLEIIKKAEELKKKTELEKRKIDCKEKGYPEHFTFYNRLGGATNNSHAYVISQNGIIREPDDNILNNLNHMNHNPDWKNNADGQQVYDQIMDGEIIFSYRHDYTRAPLVFNIEWADREATEAQLDVICGLMDSIMGWYPNVDVVDCEYQVIDRYTNDWVRTVSRKRAEEASKILKHEQEEPVLHLTDISNAVSTQKDSMGQDEIE